jgi:hypothetical protein
MDSIVKCRHLHTLHIYDARNISDVGLRKISQLQNLTSLAIFFADLITTATWAELCTKRHETLTVLKLSAHCLEDAAMDSIIKCRHLHTLHIHEATNISDVGLMKISQLHNLTSLLISYAYMITTTTWIELMSKPSLSRLRHLELSVCDTLNKEVLNVMKINCQHLEKLRLFHCRNIKKRSATTIARGFRKLEKILFAPPNMF